jgi:hypothetical protein
MRRRRLSPQGERSEARKWLARSERGARQRRGGVIGHDAAPPPATYVAHYLVTQPPVSDLPSLGPTAYSLLHRGASWAGGRQAGAAQVRQGGPGKPGSRRAAGAKPLPAGKALARLWLCASSRARGSGSGSWAAPDAALRCYRQNRIGCIWRFFIFFWREPQALDSNCNCRDKRQLSYHS